MHKHLTKLSNAYQELDREHNDEHYRRRCLRCLRKLVQNSGTLPPSFFLCNIVRQGNIDPIWGGGFAVHFCNYQFIWESHMPVVETAGYLERKIQQRNCLSQSLAAFPDKPQQGEDAEGKVYVHTV
jgi:hypothetical protein